MRHGKKILALLLMLALLASMGVSALAEDAEDAVIVVEEPSAETGDAGDAGTGNVGTGDADVGETKTGDPDVGVIKAGDTEVEETESKMTVKCVDADGKTIRDEKDDYLDLSKDLVVDEKYSRPEIENYTYQKMMVGEDEINKLTVTHNESGPVITVTIGEGEEAKEKILTGSETLVFVYAQTVVPHEHSWDDGKVTKAATCTEKGEKTYTCGGCGATQTEEIPPLGHDWADPSYTWSADNSACEAKRVCKRDSAHTESESVKPTETITKEPTCTEKGEKTLTASFSNSAFAAQSKNVELPALGHDFAHGHCKRCGALDPNFKPKLWDSSNGHASWGTDYVVYSDAAPKDFQKVVIDGAVLSSSDYKVTEKDGNTVVTVKGSFIKNLAVGQHKISVVSSTGTAGRTFNVSDKPKTGDESMALWTGLLILSALGSSAAIVTLRKKYSAE